MFIFILLLAVTFFFFHFKKVDGYTGSAAGDRLLMTLLHGLLLLSVLVFFIIAYLRLKASEAFNRNIADLAPNAIHVYDLATGATIYANKNIKNLHGYTQEELCKIGLDIVNFIHPDDLERELALQQIYPKMKDDEVIEVEYRIKHKNGEWQTIYTRNRAFKRNDNGEVVQLLGISVNITEVKKAAESLRQTNTMFENAETAAGIGSWSWNMDTNEFTASKNLFRIYSFEPFEFEPTVQAFLQLIHPEDRDRVSRQLSCEAFTPNKFLTLNYRIIDKKGRLVHIQAKRKYYHNAKGEKMILGTAQDISVLVRVINRLSRAITSLKDSEAYNRALNHDLVEKNKELLQSNEELASFNYVASHDLQEPLRKIQTFISFLAEKEMNISDQGKTYLQRTQMAATRMRNLIGDLLSYSRTTMTEGGAQHVDLNAVFHNAQTVLRASIEDKKAIIRSETLPGVVGVDFQMQQLFENLIGNAVKYCRPGVAPVINITAEKVRQSQSAEGLERTQWFHKISFADNGIGFEQEYAGKIFELFQRLHSKYEYEGTGIGLAICKKIVQQHGGMIEANGVPGAGATFTVYIPVAEIKQEA